MATRDWKFDLQRIPLEVRPETGPLSFEGDWPGVFIRGDHALHLAKHYRKPKDKWLHDLLCSCVSKKDPHS
jgi:hypothetical protein